MVNDVETFQILVNGHSDLGTFQLFEAPFQSPGAVELPSIGCWIV